MPARDFTLANGNAIAQQDSAYVLIGSTDSNWSSDYNNIVDYLTESDMTPLSMGVGDSQNQPSANTLFITDSDIFADRTVHDMKFAGGGSSGVSQDLFDSATSEITSLRDLLDSANTALANAGSSSTQVQRWVT